MRFLTPGIIVIILVVFIYLINKFMNNGSKYEKFQRNQPYQELTVRNKNKKEYIGRMDTPPADSFESDWNKTNPKNYIGRMNTPAAMGKKKKYCPLCGQVFTEMMNQLLLKKQNFYCQHCGNDLQSFF